MKEVTSAMSMTLDIVLALGMADDLDVSTPCRSYDPDLWFAETPDQVALAHGGTTRT